MTKIPKKISRYEIAELIGKGSMGVIYKAYDPLIKRFVAIKKLKLDFINPEEQEEFIKRFYKEAQIAGTLNHPNIALIYDAGEYNNIPYICMEYVQGIPLNQWAAEIDKSELLKNFLVIIKQIANALDYAHSQGVIHRDIKPANILITENLQAKILDFGLALFANVRTTKEGKLIGTPYYMAPEQVLGEKIDHRVDIFAIGIITYELLTGKIPFYADTISGILSKIAYSEPDLNVKLEFKEINYNDWQKIFKKVLAKKPQERYPTVSLFVKDLEKLFQKSFSEEITDEIPEIFDKTVKMDHPFIQEEIIGKEKELAEETIIEANDTGVFSSAQKIPEKEESVIELEEKETIIVEEAPTEIIAPKELKKIAKKPFPFKYIFISFILLFGLISVIYLLKFKESEKKPKLPLVKSIQKKEKYKSPIHKTLEIKKPILTIETIPNGAEIYQENSFIGTTPYIFQAPPSHPLTLTFKKDGYESINFELKPINSDINISLALPMKIVEIKYAEVNINSEPPESNVYWRGKLIGKTPVNLKNLKPGKYIISIEKPGYKKWEGVIEALPNKKNVINAKLEKMEIIVQQPTKKTETKIQEAISTKPEPISKTYPSLPSKVKIGGDVKLKLTISEKGEVEEIEIISSPDPILSQAAIKAAQKWTFKPATKNNKPIKGIYELIFRFQIK